MIINARIEELAEKKLVGMRVMMSFAMNKTRELWRDFVPRRGEIFSAVGTHLYSVEVYPEGFFDHFNLGAKFEKWVVVEVTDDATMPPGMEYLTLPAGKYAVFLYQGAASEGAKTYQYIFEEWLPVSDYLLDERPHFALMGERYRGEEPDSEEEIWIPVKPKELS